MKQKLLNELKIKILSKNTEMIIIKKLLLKHF